jgi:hypothetical protein
MPFSASSSVSHGLGATRRAGVCYAKNGIGTGHHDLLRALAIPER